jgi:hypothetical protein
MCKCEDDLLSVWWTIAEVAFCIAIYVAAWVYTLGGF